MLSFIILSMALTFHYDEMMKLKEKYKQCKIAMFKGLLKMCIKALKVTLFLLKRTHAQ